VQEGIIYKMLLTLTRGFVFAFSWATASGTRTPGRPCLSEWTAHASFE